VGEFLVHRATGLAINASDGVALADAIAELSIDPALRRRLTEAARSRVYATFGAESMATAFSVLLNRLCSADSGPASKVEHRESMSRPMAIVR
jgi:glycosyltransferase involved in cell wall biosynthesis